jgi:hypothetical protein
VATVVLPLPQAADTGTTWVWWPSEENGTVEKGKKTPKATKRQPAQPSLQRPSGQTEVTRASWLYWEDGMSQHPAGAATNDVIYMEVA